MHSVVKRNAYLSPLNAFGQVTLYSKFTQSEDLKIADKGPLEKRRLTLTEVAQNVRKLAATLLNMPKPIVIGKLTPHLSSIKFNLLI